MKARIITEIDGKNIYATFRMASQLSRYLSNPAEANMRIFCNGKAARIYTCEDKDGFYYDIREEK